MPLPEWFIEQCQDHKDYWRSRIAAFKSRRLRVLDSDGADRTDGHVQALEDWLDKEMALLRIANEPSASAER